MAGQIRVSPETLQARAGEYGKAADDVNTILTNLTRLQDQLRSEWEGAAFQGFDNQFNELSPKVAQFSELLQEINQQLTKTAQVIHEQDQQLSKSFGLNR